MLKINKSLFTFFIVNCIVYSSCALSYYYGISKTNPRISSDMVLLSCVCSFVLMFCNTRKRLLVTYHIWLFGMVSFLYWSVYVADYMTFVVEYAFSFLVYKRIVDDRKKRREEDGK